MENTKLIFHKAQETSVKVWFLQSNRVSHSSIPDLEPKLTLERQWDGIKPRQEPPDSVHSPHFWQFMRAELCRVENTTGQGHSNDRRDKTHPYPLGFKLSLNPFPLSCSDHGIQCHLFHLNGRFCPEKFDLLGKFIDFLGWFLGLVSSPPSNN